MLENGIQEGGRRQCGRSPPFLMGLTFLRCVRSIFAKVQGAVIEMFEKNAGTERKPSDSEAQEKDPMLASDIIGGCGFSLTVAWVFLTTYSRVLTLGANESSDTFALLRLVGLVAFVAGFYALRRFYEIVSMQKTKKVLMIACVAMGVFLPLLYLAASVLIAPPLPFFILAWAAHGLSSSLLFGYWGRFSSMLPFQQITPTIIGVFFAAGCWFFIVSNLVGAYSIIALLIMPSLSLMCFLIYERDSAMPRNSDPTDVPIKTDSQASNVSGMLNGVVLGMLLYVIVLSVKSVDIHMMIAASLVIAAAVLAVAFVAGKRRFFEYGLTRRILFPLSVGCLMLLMFDTGEFAYVLFALLLVAFYVLDIVNWSTVALFGSLYRTQPIYSFSSVRLPFTLGTAMGWGVGLVAFGDLIPGFGMPFEVVAAVVIVLLALSVSVAPFGSEAVRRGRGLLADEVKADGGTTLFHGTWKRACVAVAGSYGLTPREREVFLLLAKGRNAAVIEKELVVSPSTVKTHIYHVYQKLNVSSHQELLDLVEAEVKSGATVDKLK